MARLVYNVEGTEGCEDLIDSIRSAPSYKQYQLAQKVEARYDFCKSNGFRPRNGAADLNERALAELNVSDPRIDAFPHNTDWAISKRVDNLLEFCKAAGHRPAKTAATKTEKTLWRFMHSRAFKALADDPRARQIGTYPTARTAAANAE
jgi:hypothetical protein